MYGRGTYFLSDLVKDTGAYHLPNTRPINAETLLTLYQRDFVEDIEVEFSESHSSSRSKNPHLSHHPRKCKTTHALHDSSSSEEGSQVEGNVAELDIGSHRPAFNIHSGKIVDSTSSNLSAIQHQFASDVFQLVPSPKLASEPPWILLNAVERQGARVDIFDSLDLGGVSSQIQYQITSNSDWNDLRWLGMDLLAIWRTQELPLPGTQPQIQWQKCSCGAGFYNSLIKSQAVTGIRYNTVTYWKHMTVLDYCATSQNARSTVPVSERIIMTAINICRMRVFIRALHGGDSTEFHNTGTEELHFDEVAMLLEMHLARLLNDEKGPQFMVS
ncbi:uncharacterized protein BJ212DRAFT_1299141 [Suillus subaureus]|uniref:Uncharacterized protein n=1 Tax=Suillus subaureus TaxID=48587 RepID=A0A9P7ECM7_9AGAM|nr:uncharacterized protein BJ212DRAFT_1299141 [Suillus subaureus]KAG1817604.1 hypothetical protein BJ212DRAFT_1299141 [Suillus subaureus]